jgi:assimilatory nitrate reductase electron transfer subunit
VNGIVVIGNGMAGARLVTELRERDADVPITVVGAEKDRPYNRILLSNVLAGTARPDRIGLLQPDWYEANGVEVRLGVEALAIDRDARLVTTIDGGSVAYDTLVLATGSTAVIPPIHGLADGLPDGVVAFRTLDDCHDILRAARDARRAVVVGGGLLGVEAARGLAGRGLPVTLVHLAGHLMERQLDAGAGKVLARTLGSLGIVTRVSADVTAVVAEGRVTGVAVGADVLEADLVVMACGVRPETSLARAAGLAVERGVVVDGTLTSVSDPAIRAIGDCSQFDGTVHGLVAPAWEQARVLADLLTGADPLARFTGSRAITRLKAADVDLAAMGETHHDALDEAPGTEVLQFADAARGTYKKIVIRDDRLVGAVLLGETSAAGTLTQLFDRSDPLPSDRLTLLFPGAADGSGQTAGSPVRMPDSAKVCSCNNVTKGAIRACWEGGARTADEVSARTKAATGCGSCREALEGIVEWLDQQEPAPANSGQVPA